MSLSDDAKRWTKLHNDSPAERVKKLEELLAEYGVHPDDLGAVRQVTIRQGSHQGFHKDDDTGDAVVTDLANDRVKITLDPTWKQGPLWPVVQPADPVTIRATTAKPRALDGGWLKAIIYPDTQIGWRRDLDGNMAHAMHDPQAMACALAVAKVLRPDLQVSIGDDLDLAEISRFAQSPAFQRTVQPTIDTAHRWYAAQRATAPWSDIVAHDGNHNKRLADWVKQNAMAAFGLRRAELAEDWPVLSVPHLLRFDELDIAYADGYPADEHWLNDQLKTRHGKIVRKRGTAAAVVVDEAVSTIQGHIHRIEEQWLTRHTRNGPQRVMAASPGCLCRLDGVVPSFGSGEDAKGQPVGEWENWQHGCSVVYYHPGGEFFYLGLKIVDGRTIFDGKLIEADPAVVEMLSQP